MTEALRRRLPVVTGNKKMLAHHLPELIELQKEMHTALLYDASACGSIPVIRNLEEYYDNDLQVSVKGILNGSSNFILSKIFNEGMDHAALCIWPADSDSWSLTPRLTLTDGIRYSNW